MKDFIYTYASITQSWVCLGEAWGGSKVKRSRTYFGMAGTVLLACLGVLSASSLWGAAPAASPQTLPDLVAAVSPAVLNIQATQVVSSSASFESYMQNLVGGTGSAPIKDIKQTSLGSGFVVALTKVDSKKESDSMRDVLILTNAHVIESANEIEVITGASNKHYKATLVGRDGQNDIAVLKSRLPDTIQPLLLGASKELRVGESLFAIGNPFGLGHTVTSGILSAKDRSLGIGRVDRYLQTDVAINFGNSGGPLFNLQGQVIGINTLVRADAHGIGFAIPSDTILKIVPGLQSGQRVSRPWLGIVAQVSNTALKKHYGLVEKVSANETLEGGIIVLNLVKDAPAHKIGIKEGDLIVGLKQGESVVSIASPEQLRGAVEGFKVGDNLELKLQRGSKLFWAKMALSEAPSDAKLPWGYDYD